MKFPLVNTAMFLCKSCAIKTITANSIRVEIDCLRNCTKTAIGTVFFNTSYEARAFHNSCLDYVGKKVQISIGKTILCYLKSTNYFSNDDTYVEFELTFAGEVYQEKIDVSSPIFVQCIDTCCDGLVIGC